MKRFFYPRSWVMLLFIACFLQGAAQSTVTVTGNVSTLSLSGGSFENPNLPPNSFQYQPPNGDWTFSGGAGIATNGSVFICGGVTTSYGDQVLFLQNNAAAEQTLYLNTSGVYRLSFRAAQRACYNDPAGQKIRLSVDGVVLDDFHPTGSSFADHSTLPLELSAGLHQVKLEGLSGGVDNTVFVDNLEWQKLPIWGDASIWSTGTVPTASEKAVIPGGMVVAMTQSSQAQRVDIAGLLTVAINTSISLESEEIMIMNGGVLEIGRETVPFESSATITLLGAVPDPETKFLHVMGGGRLELHGAPRWSWTQLSATAAANASTITVKDTVNWEVGDHIVIASTDFDMDHAEERTITAISSDKKTLTLNSPLVHKHFGDLQTYTKGNQSWEVDERAEVGLLSHNIKIQGDANSPGLSFGGNIMVMRDPVAGPGVSHIQNVELFQMGQRKEMGLYPFHWHVVGDASGQYIRNSSIHHTYNRAITIHRTNNTRVENNVAYDNLGHAYFMEDGVEEGNVITGNLGLVTRRPDPQYALLGSDHTQERNGSGPSTFWITHPNNIVQNNHAGGSDGSGFWFAYPDIDLPDGYIDNNVAHSNYHGWLLGMPPTGGTDPNLNKDFVPPTIDPEIEHLTVYKNGLGIYSRVGDNSRNSTYRDVIVADNYIGDANTWKSDLYNFLWVGASANYEPVSGNRPDLGRVGQVVGHILYDGPAHIHDSYFAGFNQSNFTLFDQWGANLKYTGHSMRNTQIEPGSFQVDYRNDYVGPVWFNAVIYDIDGSATGSPMTAIFQDHEILKDPSSSYISPGLSGMINTRRYCYIEMRTSDETFPPISPGTQRRQVTTFRRSDGAKFVETRQEIEGVSLVPMVNDVYGYSMVFHQHIPSITRFEFFSMNSGEYVILDLPGVPSTARAYTGNPSGRYGGAGLSQLPARSSLSQLKTTYGSGSFYDGAANKMYIRFQAPSGANFEGNSLMGALFVCLEGNCVEGQNQRFPGLFELNKQDGNKTGVKLASSCDNSPFQTVLDFGQSILEATNNDWTFDLCDWNKDGYMDIACIQKQNTGSNSVELHILDGKQNFKSFLLQTGTGLNYMELNDDAYMADYNGDGKEDLWFVFHNSTGSNMTEVHILDGNNLQNFLVHTTTALSLIPNSDDDFAVSDWDGDNRPDLWYIKKQGGSGQTEVHILKNNGSSSANFATFSLQKATALHVTGSNWTFEVGDYNRDNYPDLVGVLRDGASGKSEVHILNGSNEFQSFLLHQATGLAAGTVNNVYLYDNATRSSILGYDKSGEAAGVRETVMADESGLRVFPNPFTENLSLWVDLKKAEEISIVLYDISGRQVHVQKSPRLEQGEHKLELSLQDLAKGLYLYEVQVGDQLFRGKVVKE